MIRLQLIRTAAIEISPSWGLAAELEVQGYRRVWIEGGGQVVQSMIAIGRIDVFEIALIPGILGDGIPLFPQGTSELKLRLVRYETKAKGALHPVCEPMD
jgi:dihydrofolate reductase